MNTAVRIIKSGTVAGRKSLPASVEKTTRQGQRDIAIIVKTWIAELEQRRRDQERSYSLLKSRF